MLCLGHTPLINVRTVYFHRLDEQNYRQPHYEPDEKPAVEQAQRALAIFQFDPARNNVHNVGRNSNAEQDTPKGHELACANQAQYQAFLISRHIKRYRHEANADHQNFPREPKPRVANSVERSRYCIVLSEPCNDSGR